MTTALILGAAVWETGPSPTLQRRTNHAAHLYHQGQVSRIIACGGLGKHPPSEAEAMLALLLEKGVPRDAISLEDQSTNTAENIRNALGHLTEADVVIVTDWFHAPRARLTARRAGLKASSASPSLKGARFIPQLKGALREIPAFVAYAFGWRS